jgi:predicted RNA polymerase sigma factor
VPADPKAWPVTVAARKVIDAQRSDLARRRREEAATYEREPGPTEQADNTLLLLFLCCHPALNPASAIALTLRAVGSLTTKQIADAFLVPEAGMAQRISRAKRTLNSVALLASHRQQRWPRRARRAGPHQLGLHRDR